ncbi:MAG: hypothetical protein RR350_08975, partial [Oscillibacter sp.]
TETAGKNSRPGIMEGILMDEKPLKIKVSLSLDEDIVLQLRSIATEDDRALSSYINLVLRDHLRKRNEKQ